MVNKLESITQETCCHKLKALTSAYVSERQLHCRNGCNGEICENYKPLKNTQLRYAYLRLYGGKYV